MHATNCRASWREWSTARFEEVVRTKHLCLPDLQHPAAASIGHPFCLVENSTLGDEGEGELGDGLSLKTRNIAAGMFYLRQSPGDT